MFVKVGNKILNTAHIVECQRSGSLLQVTTTAMRNESYQLVESVIYVFEGAEATALWDYLSSALSCTDVLAVRNGHPSVKHPFVQSLEDACKTPVRP